MTLQSQWQTVKSNWLLVVILIVGIFIFSMSGDVTQFAPSYDMAVEEVAYAGRMAPSFAPSSYQPDFAPEVVERKITKTASLTTEVEHGTFKDADAKLKAIVAATDSFLLNENVNAYKSGKKQYFRGSYQLKVETGKYDAIISQLKEIGKVRSFNEKSLDVTAQYTNTEIELAAEKERLERYESMYAEAIDVEDKIILNDRIFDQERTVKYLEDALKRIDQRVDYSTISVTIDEEQPAYANIVLVKFSHLISNLVESFNGLVSFIFFILPWAIAIGIITWIVKKFKKK